MTAGPGGRHDVERDIPEILQEVRVAQTGGQLFFAFLFSVAFAPGFDDLDGQQRLLYACDLFVVATASTLLVAPVAIHRWNFGRGLRPQFLVAAHWLACAGLVFLAVGRRAQDQLVRLRDWLLPRQAGLVAALLVAIGLLLVVRGITGA